MESGNFDTVESIMERYTKDLELNIRASLLQQGSRLSLAVENLFKTQEVNGDFQNSVTLKEPLESFAKAITAKHLEAYRDAFAETYFNRNVNDIQEKYSEAQKWTLDAAFQWWEDMSIGKSTQKWSTIVYENIIFVLPIIVFLLLSALEMHLLFRDNITHSPRLAKRRSCIPILLLIPALPVIHFVITSHILSTQWRDILFAFLGVLTVMKWNSFCGNMMDKMEAALIAEEKRLKEEEAEAEARRIEQEAEAETRRLEQEAEAEIRLIQQERKDHLEEIIRVEEARKREKDEKLRRFIQARNAYIAEERIRRALAAKEEHERIAQAEAAQRVCLKEKTLAMVAQSQEAEEAEEREREKAMEREERALKSNRRMNKRKFETQQWVERQHTDPEIGKKEEALNETEKKKKEVIDERRKERKKERAEKAHDRTCSKKCVAFYSSSRPRRRLVEVRLNHE
ncbi:hypothetical protein HYALB_00007960 [Hymenoscyphus albidus]|uniref:Uncharacterized protein n=1 Tax=Hymenoscyphus albidus TaxID=595503 RepID=A0A9N9LHF6_9HELO|nr:hypothetical protein HYALB_00007960 [Hymenoscyphus albidus]